MNNSDYALLHLSLFLLISGIINQYWIFAAGPEEVVMEDGLGVEVDLVGADEGKGAVDEEGEGVAVRKFLLKIWMRTWQSTTQLQWRPAK